jgi:DNA-binding transcriptional LysR family regulator
LVPASEIGRFPDLNAVPVLPPVQYTTFLAWAKNERMGPASAKFAELLLTEAGHDFRAE